MKFEIGDNRELDIKVNFYTLYLYENEFGSDMIKDVFGVIKVRELKEDDDGGFELDYTTTNWTALTRALWASAKCADEDIPRYSEWAKTMGDGINMYALSGSFINIVRTELFRIGVPAELSK